MQSITTIGLDIAKSVFQVHGVDAAGQVVIRRLLKRRYVLAFFEKLPPCLVGIKACASSHHWSRELLALGHSVRLMPPAYGFGRGPTTGITIWEALCSRFTTISGTPTVALWLSAEKPECECYFVSQPMLVEG